MRSTAFKKIVKSLFVLLLLFLPSFAEAKPKTLPKTLNLALKKAGYDRVQILTAQGNSSSCPNTEFCHQISVRKSLNTMAVLLTPYEFDGDVFDSTKGHWNGCENPKRHEFFCKQNKSEITYCLPKIGELPPDSVFPISYRSKEYDLLAWLSSEDNLTDYLNLISIISCSID